MFKYTLMFEYTLGGQARAMGGAESFYLVDRAIHARNGGVDCCTSQDSLEDIH